ncbi:MAG TPA: type II toxin-antitoxin system Phd/YefM family antitoxin [Anaerolineae bacterium]|nr:type II toxin-antitoxin system Phd/YefM family antitoxin [Anaerolineae bacterium]
MERVVSATEARIRFGELMRQAVETRGAIVVERGGKPHVVVLSVEEYQRLLKRERQGEWKELVQGARAQIEADLGGRTLPPPEEILAQAREGRDEQLLAMR